MNAQLAADIIQQMPHQEVEELFQLLGVEKVDTNKFTKLLQTFYSLERNDVCMTVKECADFLDCHKNTIINQIEKGTILANKVGTEWRIPKMQFVKEILAKNAILPFKPNEVKRV